MFFPEIVNAPYFGLVSSYSFFSNSFVDSYAAASIGFPYLLSFRLGLNVEIFDQLSIGFEGKVLNFEAETYHVQFNRYGDAYVKSDSQLDYRYALGVNICYNFDF